MATIKPVKTTTSPISQLLREAEGIPVNINKRVKAWSEDELLNACLLYIKMQYPKLFAFGSVKEKKVRRKRVAFKLKDKRVKRWLPSVMILTPFAAVGSELHFAGTVIELKAPGRTNDTSVDQQNAFRSLEALYFDLHVEDNFDKVKAIIDRNYGGR